MFQLDFSQFDTTLFIRGNISIHLESYGNSTEDEIQFHLGPNIKIERMRLRKDGKKFYAKTFKREESKKLGRISLRDPLQKGKYILEMAYNMTICDEDVDGVRCSLDNQNNSSLKSTSFTTKFEPTLARAFFPCWDEPGVKATFNITVKHHKKYTVLSNMPPIEQRKPIDWNEQWKTTVFQTTPPMSTYLLAFAIGEFVKLETRTERGIPVTVWTYPEDVMSMKFTLEYAPVIFDRLEDALEIPYPLPKIDLIAARNFHVGGMENWGLIVFEFASIAYTPPITDHVNETVDRMYNEFRIGKLIAHEAAHQWFGNLVTMRDWSELFLNEGFATFYVYEMMSSERPVTAQFEYYDSLAALVAAQSEEDHRLSLVRELATESQVESSFHPTNLYTKGCVLIRMLRDLVSDFDFKAAVRRYLRKNAYRSVSRDDLFASLPAYADHGAEQEKLFSVLEGWFVNEGLPEITLIRNYDNEMMTISQKKTVHHEYRSFLKDRKSVATVRYRGSRSAEDGSTLFDDTLFDGYIERKKDKRRKHRPARRKASTTPPISLISRRDELRKPRRVGASQDLWTIPITYMFGSLKTSEGQVIREFWLKNRTVSFGDAEISPNQAVLVNPEWKYSYRVNYDLLNWKLLARTLHQNHLEINDKSRMQLLLDAEYFLSNSVNPHLYLYLLGYLAHETKMEVMLFGIDAVYRFIDVFKATQLNKAILVYFEPVISQMDHLLNESQVDAETASLWLVKPERLAKLYQMRCAAGLPSCKNDYYTQKWSRAPDEWTEDVHKQVTAVCHQLFTNTPDEVKTVQDLLDNRLHSSGAKWALTVQLAACSHGQKLLRKTARAIVSTKNAAVYASALQSDFSLHYNPTFRKYLWNEISKMSNFEKTALFSTNSTNILPASRILLHSVKTIDELQQIRGLLTNWGPLLTLHFEYLERYLLWISSVSQGVLHQFFAADLSNF
uniref:Aminopeptidase n=1 Tax=Caenorhabditis tropicalis TaxID=1561998 RepID=A0A1I7TFV9_9PELO